MLQPLHGIFPIDKRIAGIHSIPITDDGLIVMVWDKNEKALTTVGGRIENDEDIHTALDRETIEEAGIILESLRIPIASWYWESTDTYTIFVMARVKKYTKIPEGFETTGMVRMNFETARQIVFKMEGEGLRTELLALAEQVYLKFFE
ncbi:NUDIX domain-containing protein [Paenibacillus psychroresistens]|uniref:NUDIX domain-containing protein n=1 Tax=Paenibacillus psychroresistens TaxID=1778678 RepID=A0A6B8RSE1_9BACL|nr:NUDIX domain-containing protein [Paenibacillus psychroresistens]QGQ99330.1 NUDIX domain-containing protein [Paenibacillus psychroresistens]